MAKRLGCQQQEIEKRLESILKQRAELEKEVARLRQKQAEGQANAALDTAIDLGNDLKAIIAKAEAKNPNELRGTAAQTLSKLGEGLVILGAEMGNKISIVAVSSPASIAAGFPAGEQIRSLAESLGGKGGGKPDMAMGGAANEGQLAAALEEFRKKLA